MKFSIIQKDDQYLINEGQHTVFTIDYARENKLLSIYLRNVYGDEILGFYQVKKWYTPVKPGFVTDFTVYEKELKLGELHHIKDGFELIYHGVIYRFYCGERVGKRTLIVFDREEMIAEMIIDEECSVSFKHNNLGALWSLLCVLVKNFIPKEKFTQESFVNKYRHE